MDASCVRDEKGKFSSKRKISHRKNIVIANKRRKNESTSNFEFITDGRRVVELQRLALELWCDDCNGPLSLRFLEKESVIGLNSILWVRCHVCLKLRSFSTNSDCNMENKENHVYSVNLKAALALIDAGIADTKFNTILSTLNIPTVHHTLLKRNEKYIEGAIKKVADDSCREALREEKRLTEISRGMVPSSNVDSTPNDIMETNLENRAERVGESDFDEMQQNIPPTECEGSVDAAWQKKSGRVFNSLSGHSSTIGVQTGKIIAYATRNKRCILCEKGHPREDHDCRRNHAGSSKSMEPAMTVEMITQNNMLKQENVIIKTIIADDDSSTIAQVRATADYRVEKWSDINHAKVNMSNMMWKLKIPYKIIEYMKYCFSCVLKKNKGNVNAVREGLKNIVPHAYDDHTNCGNWCNYSENPETYKHKILPNGKGLTDLKVKNHLENVLQKFINNAEKLSPCGSTQRNESFNNMVASKAPKSNHYSGGSSNDNRIRATVCQKNIGTSWVMNTMHVLSLSPGSWTKKHRLNRDQIRKLRAVKEASIKHKRRRRQLFAKKRNNTAAEESLEGISYLSGCALDETVEVQDLNMPTVSNEVSQHSDIIFFDIETTGLSKGDQIVQISAKKNEANFNVYIAPTCKFSQKATDLTGLNANNGELFLHGSGLSTAPRRQALVSFIDFLKPGPCILVAHDGGGFDFPRLLHQVRQLQLMNDFESSVAGFCDTLLLFKEKLQNRVQQKGSFQLSALYNDFVNEDVDDISTRAHDSLFDIIMMEKVTISLGINDGCIRDKAMSLSNYISNEIRFATIRSLQENLKCLGPKVSACMKKKMASAGISLQHLKKAYTDGGEESIAMLLSANLNGRPRVTKTKRVIENIVNVVKELCNVSETSG